MAFRLLSALLTAVALIGCGQMGPLYLPGPTPVEGAAEPATQTTPEATPGASDAKDSDA